MGMTTKEILQGVHDWTDGKFSQKDGFYEQMVVGEALALAGQTQRTNDAMYRKSGGSEEVVTGTAEITNIKGKTVAWNQLVIDGSTEVVIASTTQYTGVEYFSGVSCVIGHKYYISAEIKSSSDYTRFSAFDNFSGAITISDASASVYKHYSIIGSLSSLPHASLAKRPARILEYKAGGGNYIAAKNAFCLDLTLLGIDDFTTTAQVEQWLAENVELKDYYPYDEGRLRSVQLESLKTVGFNQFNPTTNKAKVIGGIEYQITGTYTSITLNGGTITPDTNGKFTPTTTGELQIVGGSSSDTCIHIAGHKDDTYEPYEEHVAPVPVTTLTGKLNGEGASVTLFPDGMNKFDSLYTQGDKTCAIVGGETRAYQEGDVTSGTMVTDGVAHTYVALATPLVYEVEGFTLPKTYLVDGGGTEEQVQKANVQGLAAILTCIYGVDAVGFINKAPQRFIGEDSMDNFLAKLNIATGGTWSKTFNENTGEWDFNYTPAANTNANTNEESI